MLQFEAYAVKTLDPSLSSAKQAAPLTNSAPKVNPLYKAVVGDVNNPQKLLESLKPFIIQLGELPVPHWTLTHAFHAA